MKKQLPNDGAAAKPTPPVKVRVAIFSDSARADSEIEDARRSLEAAGYELVRLRTNPAKPKVSVPLPKWKKFLHAHPQLRWLITVIYSWIPLKRWWTGVRRWVYKLDADGQKREPEKQQQYAMLFGLKEIDEYLEALKRHDEDCPDIIIVDLYSLDDSDPGMYIRNIAADRYFGKLVPAGLAEAVRGINACIRVAICSEASPDEDPIVKLFHLGGLAATGRKNPRGPVIFFPKAEWSKHDSATKEQVRFLRRELRVARVTVGVEPLRKWKRSLHARPLLSRLITAIYPWIPFKRWWAGDRRWVYELDANGQKMEPVKRHLLRTTVLVTDYAAVVKELIKIGTFSKRFYNLNLAEVARQAQHGGRKVRVLLIDDTGYQRSKWALVGLESWCDLTVCTSAGEAMGILGKLRDKPKEQWPDVVLCDLYMPGYVDKNGALRPRNDRERHSARLLPFGFAIALVARSMGLRVGICTDLRHHHNDRIVGLLGNLSTLSSPMGFVAGGVQVYEVIPNYQVEECYVPGYGIVTARYGSVDDKPKYWRGKFLRLQGRFPKWMRSKLHWPGLRDPIYECYDVETRKYRTTVLSKDLYAIKHWGKVLKTLIQSPIIHPELRDLPKEILDQFGIKN